MKQAVKNLTENGVHVRGGKAEVARVLAENNVQTANLGALAETLFRTQSMQAYSAGRWNTVNDNDFGKYIWGFQYITAHDQRVREGHRVLEGVRLPKDDPFWQKYFPPNGWNCRCTTLEIWRDDPEAVVHFGITGRDPRTRKASELNTPPEFRGNVGMIVNPKVKPEPSKPIPKEPESIPIEPATPADPEQTKRQNMAAAWNEETVKYRELERNHQYSNTAADVLNELQKAVDEWNRNPLNQPASIVMKLTAGEKGIVFFGASKGDKKWYEVKHVKVSRLFQNGVFKIALIYDEKEVNARELLKAQERKMKGYNQTLQNAKFEFSLDGKSLSEWETRMDSGMDIAEISQALDRLNNLGYNEGQRGIITLQRKGEKLLVKMKVRGKNASKTISRDGSSFVITGNRQKFDSLDAALKECVVLCAPGCTLQNVENDLRNRKIGFTLANEPDNYETENPELRSWKVPNLAQRAEAARSFQPSETLEDAEIFASTLGVETDYSEFPVEFANGLNQAMARLIECFPECGISQIGWMTSSEALGDELKGTFGACWRVTGVVKLNPRLIPTSISELAKIRKTQKNSGEKASSHPFATVYHEMGHALETKLISVMANDPKKYQDFKDEMEKKWDKIQGLSEAKQASILSTYGATTWNEMLAESVSEFLGEGENCRPFAREVVEIWKKHARSI